MKLLAISLLLLALIPIASAEECYDLASTSFTSTHSGQEIILCENTYTTGILISGVTDFTLDCGGATLESAVGITVKDSSKIAIRNCLFAGKSGIEVTDSRQLTIEENTFSVQEEGLALSNVQFASIRSNKFDTGSKGIVVENSTSLEISRNEFYELPLGLSLIESSNNKFYKNICFVGVGESTCAQVSGGSGNSWDEAGEGNFWSDYSGSDQDEDGIGDEPYIISESDQDNYPFINQNLEKSAPEVVEGVINDMSGREEEFLLNVGDSVKFTCGSGKKYTLFLSSIGSKPTFYLNENKLSIKAYESNKVDVNSDELSDVNIFIQSYSIDSVNLKVIRLNNCMNYCGDGTCSAGESELKCAKDCKGDKERADADKDDYSITNGDCDDTDPQVYPGATERCTAGADYDCDGYAGEEDQDCQGLGIGFWLLVVFLVILVGGMVFLFFWERKEEPQELSEEPEPEEIPAAEIRSVSSKVRRIMDYAENYFHKGYSTAQVREILLASGWPTNDVDAAIEELERENVGMPKQERARSSLKDLRAVIRRDLDRGISKREIINTLKQRGWDNRTIKVILRDVRNE